MNIPVPRDLIPMPPFLCCCPHSPWWSLWRSPLQLVPAQRGRWQTTLEVPSECHSRGTCRRHRLSCRRGSWRASILPPCLLREGGPPVLPVSLSLGLRRGPGLPLLLLVLFCLMHHREAPAAGRAREGVTLHLRRFVGQSPEV